MLDILLELVHLSVGQSLGNCFPKDAVRAIVGCGVDLRVLASAFALCLDPRVATLRLIWTHGPGQVERVVLEFEALGNEPLQLSRLEAKTLVSPLVLLPEDVLILSI